LFSSFIPLFTTVASWIVLIIWTSLVRTHLHHYVTIPPERWLLVSWELAFPFLVTWSARVSPHSAVDSDVSV
jgi:hypothetical protein